MSAYLIDLVKLSLLGFELACTGEVMLANLRIASSLSAFAHEINTKYFGDSMVGVILSNKLFVVLSGMKIDIEYSVEKRKEDETDNASGDLSDSVPCDEPAGDGGSMDIHRTDP